MLMMIGFLVALLAFDVLASRYGQDSRHDYWSDEARRAVGG